MALGMLLPASEITAKESAAKRIINIAIEEDILRTSSQESDGPIVKVTLMNSQRQIVLTEECGSNYQCFSYVGDLPSGSYLVTVTTTKLTYTEMVSVNNE